MPAITFDKFDIGVDVRKAGAVSDANRLQVAKNVYINKGLVIEKRPALQWIGSLDPNSVGLFGGEFLNCFFNKNNVNSITDVVFSGQTVKYRALNMPAGKGLAAIPFADVFNAAYYVIARASDGTHSHHYLEASRPSSLVTDAVAPDSGIALKASSRIFCGNSDVVRFSSDVRNPSVWVSSPDSTFLGVGVNSRGDRKVRAMGMHQDKMIVLFRDGLQAWTIDPDPAKMSLFTTVENVGTLYPRSVVTVGGDLVFLSDSGFRGITYSTLTSKLLDTDMGSPIDSLVEPDINANNSRERHAVFYYKTGQYLCFGAQDNGLSAYVYTVSRSSKLAAWSTYEFPIAIDYVAEVAGVLYLRSGNQLFKLNQRAYQDTLEGGNSSAIAVKVGMPWLDFKSPGQLKHIIGMDVVCQGTCEISIGYDILYPDDYIPPIPVTGNTRPSGVIPIGICGTEFALRIEHTGNEPFRLDAITLYYEAMGAV